MSLLDIVIYPDSRLREPCEPVAVVTEEIRQLLSDMAETMYKAPGIGLAAPQVGSSHRVIVVDVSDTRDGEIPVLYKLVNPVIVERFGSTETEEGCLSIPGVYDYVKRAERVIVEALDENGGNITIDADGLLSVCLQHEIDHLDGILFIDHLSRLKKNLLKKKLQELVDQQKQQNS